MSVKLPWEATKTFAPKKTIIVNDIKDWPEGVGKIYKSGKNMVIDGEKKWKLSGKNMPGKCDQSESNEPLIRIKIPNLIFKNFEISESKNGLTWNSKNVTFDGLVFSKVCEDAINPMKAENPTIKNCFFANAQDKTIQCNYCKNVIIINNIFNGGINSIRLMGSIGKGIAKNEFHDVDTAIQVTKNGTLSIKKSDNEFYNVRTRFKTEEGGKISYLD